MNIAAYVCIFYFMWHQFGRMFVYFVSFTDLFGSSRNLENQRDRDREINFQPLSISQGQRSQPRARNSVQGSLQGPCLLSPRPRMSRVLESRAAAEAYTEGLQYETRVLTRVVSTGPSVPVHPLNEMLMHEKVNTCVVIMFTIFFLMIELIANA